MLIGVAAYLYFINSFDPLAIIKPLLKAFDPQGHFKDAEPALLKMLPFLPGFVALSWSIMIMLNSFLAQGLLVRFNRNLRPTLSVTNLTLPNSFPIVFALSFLLSFMGVGALEILGKNIALVLTFPFFFVGLSLVHSWMQKLSYPIVGLIIFYVLLFFVFWPILFVILLGILKPWIEKTFPAN